MNNNNQEEQKATNESNRDYEYQENYYICEVFEDQSILKSQIIEAKNEIDHLICPICMNILWKPLSCSECLQSFCKACINQWLQSNQQRLDQQQQQQQQNNLRQGSYQQQQRAIMNNSNSNNTQPKSKNRDCCPNCKKIFKGTNMPLINKLLGGLKLKCFYNQNGCNEVLNYDSYEKHVIVCGYLGLKCEGCQKVVFKKSMQEHQETCLEVLVKCEKCQLKIARKFFNETHTQVYCMEQQLKQKDKKMSSIQNQLNEQNLQIQKMQQQIKILMEGQIQTIQSFVFSTYFGKYFKFLNNRVLLENDSYNDQKKKKDFLHFFINKSFSVHSPIIYIWRLIIEKLQGNMLIGISDSQTQNSMDFIVNKGGDIKKKEKSENKYKQKEKSKDFVFQENDVIQIKYMPFIYTVEFNNLTQNVICNFDQKYILEFSSSFYFFFSLDHQGDTLSFVGI
ncbi:traf-type zinc finger family protein, putative [Ichthyophthirius multifiliis]|uniref:Traf-type zinc finger family protein, putative n=1 Tax=Ichthyophthirius multifiliis TaxID=5932 RepID=G0QQN2_ICHMU|nr:traf-type zinc finger family protein, putative [Ichthyophthirius multifiliis]EGR32475.1 traf-type zinc finger family protein, putative [Ichthyophthirius multifiliis]|eukprot:XP_004036461.1 traf-type zinc finger family protein, putative [Ichthyophthirius multifiliis]